MVKQNPQQIDTPFADDSDIDDTSYSRGEFRNGIFGSFSSAMRKALPERRIRFHCEYGTLVVEFYTMTVRCHMAGELLDSMLNNTQTKRSGSEGLASAVFSLIIDQAAPEKRTIAGEEIWQKTGR